MQTSERLSIAVGIATVGRQDQVTKTVELVCRQSRTPDAILVCPASQRDAPTLNGKATELVRLVASDTAGLCAQRNAMLRAAHEHDVILFLDDDFYPTVDYVEHLERLLITEPDVVGVTGRVLADGATTLGISHEQAIALLAAPPPHATLPSDPNAYGLYGCNMAFRMSAIAAARASFDENLPLYGWQEDTDFSRQVSQVGRLVRDNRLRGVHLACKSGRSPGLKLGYSQIANPVYLLKKGSLTPHRALRQMLRNVAQNVLKSPRPEPWVDRRGRLKGNVVALLDLLRGRLDPRHITRL